MPRNVCGFIYHTNIQLLLYRKCIENTQSTVLHMAKSLSEPASDPTSKSYLSPNFPLCKDKFQTKFVEELYIQGFQNGKWYQWEKSDDGRTEKVEKQGAMKDLLNSLEDQTKPFLFHYFINKEQAKAYKKCRQDPTETNSNKAMIQTDFSENFTCCYQDEVASAHWKSSVTLYTVMIWFRDCSKSIVLLSNKNNHDKTTVVSYTLHIIKAVMDLFGDEIKEIDFWTDGPSSQYKNKYVFAFIDIKLPEIFLSLRICWNYSATSHGKGAADGVKGTIKRLATRAINHKKSHCQ